MSMRLFVGIPLPDSTLSELTRLTSRLRRADDGLRWQSPESWHITLQFLGSTERDLFECALARLHEIHRAPFSVELEAPGFFERAGIFFAGVRPSSELTSLERHVVAATALCGLTPETRPYHPHITLARAKRSHDEALLSLKTKLTSAPQFTPFVVGEFLLYESKPTAIGSLYEVRERFKLSAPAGTAR